MTAEHHIAIGKEEIPSLTFSEREDIDQDLDIMRQLELATRLGNGYHCKVAIYFISDQGPRKVETTIWATGTKYICLKGGSWLPISSIERIEQ